MFKRIKRTNAANRLFEERLYEMALEELTAGQIRTGLWAKALASAGGDEKKARGLYLKYRVVSMNDEAEIARGLSEHYEDESGYQLSQNHIVENKVNRLDISKFIPLNEFSKHIGLPEKDLIEKIRAGEYHGRLFDDQWYVHKSELTS